MTRRLLSPEEIADRLRMVPEWRVENGRLVRDYTFAAYNQGVRFAVTVAGIAEELDHHPDILLSWRRVSVSVFTHSAGGLTGWDFALAEAVDLRGVLPEGAAG